MNPPPASASAAAVSPAAVGTAASYVTHEKKMENLKNYEITPEKEVFYIFSITPPGVLKFLYKGDKN